MRPVVAGAVLAAVLAAACGGDRVSPWPVADGGALRTDGGLDGGAQTTDGGEAPDGGVGDGGSATDGGAADGGTCAPNQDWILEGREVPFVVGASVIYSVNRNGETVEGISTAGSQATSGRIWDLSAARPEDHRVIDELWPPTGQWWAASYPEATFASWLDRADDLHGVYRVTTSTLELLATVSREANRTDLKMDPPVVLLRFPLSEGTTWEQTVAGRGYVDYTPLVNTNKYVFRVDAHGEVWTPAARFPALRLRSDLEQSIPLTLFRRTVRTYAFLSECWGLVARITSTDDEIEEEFTRAVEYRRLSP